MDWLEIAGIVLLGAHGLLAATILVLKAIPGDQGEATLEKIASFLSGLIVKK